MWKTNIRYHRRFVSNQTNFKRLSVKINDHINKRNSLDKLNHSVLVNYWKLYPNMATSLRTPLLNEKNIPYFSGIVNKFKGKSPLLSGFYRRELIYNSHRDLNLCSRLIQELEGGGIKLKVPADVLKYCVNDSIKTRDILIAFELINTYYKLHPNELVDTSIIKRLMILLPKCDSRIHFGCIKELISLDNLLKIKNISLRLEPNTIIALFQLGLNTNPPGLGLQLCHRMMDQKTYPLDNTLSITKMLEKIILFGYEQNLTPVVVLNWLKLRKLRNNISEVDPKLISRVLQTCLRSEKYGAIGLEIVKDCKPAFFCKNKYLLAEIINTTVKKGDINSVQNLMNQIEVNLDPLHFNSIWLSLECQTSILEMYLKFKDSEGIDKTIKKITELQSSLLPINCEAVLNYLLDDLSISSLKKAISYCDSLKGGQYLSAVSILIDRLLEDSNKAGMSINTQRIITKCLDDAHKFDQAFEHEIWDSIGYIYLKKILNPMQKVEKSEHLLNFSKHIYLKSTEIGSSKIPISTNPFLAANPEKVMLRISERNRYRILKLIGTVAYENNNKNIFQWVCYEMLRWGLSWPELVIDWNLSLNSNIPDDLTQKTINLLKLDEEHCNEKLADYLV
ncbi:hypothetical protein RNJ44_01042 [Nakaseomyces bracarensis]|uniref:Uncharacterized protein n=1 Tax=Nakaseomyces bracarensis TaxID=273131 RepID=A0ABR4NQS1_9SACH